MKRSSRLPGSSPDLGLSMLAPSGHRDKALDIHPYFGRMDPSLAQSLISQLSAPGQTVLDPFCGSGTVLHEAALAGRSAIGWDSSPLACIISLAKLAGVSKADQAKIDELTQEVLEGEIAGEGDLPVPSMPRVRSVDYWFEPYALQELAQISSWLRAKSTKVDQITLLMLRLAFSRIIVRASNQQGESSYRRVQARDEPGRVRQLFAQAIGEVTRSAREFFKAKGGSRTGTWNVSQPERGGRIEWDGKPIVVECTDTRRQRESPRLKSADLVVTSPPYLMSWDYGLYHKFRFYWLGLDLDAYEETEIGRHLRRREDDVERYMDDMAQTLKVLDEHVAPAGKLALVNAPSIVKGQEVDTNELIVQAGRASGWEIESLVPSISLTGPHHGMQASLSARGAKSAGSAGKREHVLIFRR